MPILYSASQVSAGNLPVQPINLGTAKAFEILNYSPDFLLIGTRESGATSQTDVSFVTLIEPYEGLRMTIPLGTEMTTIWVGTDSTLSTNPATFGTVTSLPGVSYVLYPNQVPPTRWKLVAQGVVGIGGEKLPISGDVTLPAGTQVTLPSGQVVDLASGATVDLATGASVLVNNTSGSPVINNPLHAGIALGGGYDLPNTTLVPITVGAVVQKLIISPTNLSAQTSATNTYMFVQLTVTSQSTEPILYIPVGALTQGQPSKPEQFDFGQGISITQITAEWVDLGSSTEGYATILAIIV